MPEHTGTLADHKGDHVFAAIKEKTNGSVSRKSGIFLLYTMVCSERIWWVGNVQPAEMSKGSR